MATADILAKKHGVDVAFLNQSGLLSLPYSRMTPHGQDGDTLCFSFVVYFTLGSLATAAIREIPERLRGLENATSAYIDMRGE